MRWTLAVWVVGFSVGTPPAAAQWAESPLLRRGQVSVYITPFLTSYDERFGLTADGTEAIEALGQDLTDPSLGTRLLPAVVGPQEQFARLLQDSATVLNLGRSQARVFKSIVRIPVGLSVGVFDWLTVGATAPFVKRRVELDFLLDPQGANAGLSPGASADDVVLFMGQAMSALASVTGRVDQTCMTAGEMDPACLAGRSFLADAAGFFADLEAAYGGPLFLFGQSAGANVLTARVDSLRAQMHSLADSSGIDTTFVAPMPFASAPLSIEQFQAFLTDGAYGLAADPLSPTESLWDLGDVELFAAIRLLGTDRDPAVEPTRDGSPEASEPAPRIGYFLGLQALYRMGTGTPARPQSSLDLGSGDGLNDVEVKLFGRLDFGRRLRARLETTYGRQLEGDVTSRVYERDIPFASFLTQLPRTVDPGDYRSWMIAPEVRLTPEVSMGARFRSFHRDADTYDPASVAELDAMLLSAESEADLKQWGLGVSYWPSAESRAEGGWPVAVTAEYLAASSGGGGQVPKDSQLRIQLRWFLSIW